MQVASDSRSPVHRATSFVLPKIENVSTKILRQRGTNVPVVPNTFVENHQKKLELCSKRQNYSQFINEHFLPVVDPNTIRQHSIAKSRSEFTEADRLAAQKKAFESFKRKHDLGNTYLKENRVPIGQQELTSKARHLLRSLSLHRIRDGSAQRLISTSTENSLVTKKQALLAMNRLNERIGVIRDAPGALNRQTLEETFRKVQEVDMGLVGDATQSMEALKTSILLKLDLISTLEDNLRKS